MPSGRIADADAIQRPARTEQLRALIAIHGDLDLDLDLDAVDAPADAGQAYRGRRSGDQLGAA